MLTRIKNELLYSGLSREDYDRIRAHIWEGDRTSVIAWYVCACVFWVLSLIMSLHSPAYVACRMVYIVALIVCVVGSVAAQWLSRRVPRTLFYLTLLLDATLLGAGIGIAVCQPDVRTVTLIVLAAIIPVSTLKRTGLTICLQLATVLAYVLAAKGVIEPDIYSWGLTNLTIFSLVGLLLGHFINRSRVERLVFEDASKSAAELQMKYAYFDQMTGLKNRRAYSEAMDRMEQGTPEQLCIIMADVDGLKVTNDSLGHLAGDELISATASCLSAAFEGNEDIYRIGGDEFCVTLRGQMDEALHRLERLDELSAAWKGRYIEGFSISHGVASSQDHDDLEATVREADRRMYEHKRQHYMDSGADGER